MSELEKTCCIVQARLGSTRFRGKVTKPMDKKLVIQWVTDRLKAVNVLQPGLIDKIIVATTTLQEDSSIVRWARFKEIPCFRGDPNDVLTRFYQCALAHGTPAWILRITADCPLIDPFLIYGLLTKQPRKDYQALAVNRHAIPLGLDAELFSFELLQNEYATNKHPMAREHVTWGMRKRNQNEDNEDYGLPFDYSALKYDLDTKEDFTRIKNLIQYL